MIVLSLLIVVFIPACDPSGGRPLPDVNNVAESHVEVHRYGRALFSINPDSIQTGLENIKSEFSIFLNANLNDPANIHQIKDFVSDTLLVSAYHQSQKIFPELDHLESLLTETFRYYRYYYSGARQPDVYSYISGFDFQNRVQFTGSEVLIALDMYLGSDYPVYKRLGLPVYLLRRFDQHFLGRDIMEEISRSKIDFRKVGGNLLDYMINEGKVLWFILSTMPDISQEVLFVYNTDELKWIDDQEGLVWAYMLENEMIYSPEPEYYQKFILDSPFTSYFGNESPPRLGAWVGYQIVAGYMNRNPEITLQQLMKEYNASKILKNSGYKPKL